jgi:hypothetical protein
VSYSEQNGQVVTAAAIESMAEVLLYRITLISTPLTGRQKLLGQALFRFIGSRNDTPLLPILRKPKRGKWTGLRL